MVQPYPCWFTISRASGIALFLVTVAAVLPASAVYIVLDEEAATLSGSGWGGSSSGGYNRDIAHSNDAAAAATWTFTGLADGRYDVVASWSIHANRSTEVLYSVGGGPAVQVNQEKFGVGPYLPGTPASNTYLFHYLGGPVTVTGGSLSVEATNNRSGPNDYMIADAVAIRPAGPRTLIMDNRSDGFATNFTGGNSEGFLAGIQYTAPNAGSAAMSSTWSFTDLAPGDYQVFATWSTHSNRSQASPFSVSSGGSPLGDTIRVNQEASPYRNDRTDLQNVDTVNWRSLGTFHSADGTLTVRLDGLDNSSGTEYVIADAIRLEQMPEPSRRPWIGVFHAGGSTAPDPWSFAAGPTGTVPVAINAGFGDGALGDQPVVGDWNGDGRDSIGVFRSGAGNNWYFTNERTSTGTDFSTTSWGSGALGDIAVAGDWNGDGVDGIGVFRTSVGGSGNNWFLSNSAASPSTDISFHYGDGTAAHGDLPIVGDWNGDGIDTVGVYRTTTNTFHLNNDFGPGPTAYSFPFGQMGDIPVAEDWNGDGKDDIGLFRPATGEWFFDTNFDGFFETYNPGFGNGLAGDLPLAGSFFIPEPSTFLSAWIGLMLACCARRRRGNRGSVRDRSMSAASALS